MMGSRRGLAWLASVCVVGGLLAPATPALASPGYPSVAVTAHSATVTEYGSVDASGATSPSGADYPVSMSVFLDGTLVSQTLGPPGGGFVTGPVPCDQPAGAKTCSLSMTYPVGVFVGHGSLVVTMLTANGQVVSSAPVAVLASVQPATTAVDYEYGDAGAVPEWGAHVYQDQSIGLSITGGSDYEHQVYLKSIELLIDGVVVDTAPCDVPPGQSYCATDTTWDVSGYPLGAHTLQSRLTLVSGQTATSVVSHVQVEPEPATVTVRSPTAGATVSGVVSVAATATVLADGGDAVATLALSVDGDPVGSPTTCPGAGRPTSCSVTLSWDARALPDGPYELSVVLVTQNNDTTAGSVDVNLVNPAPPTTPAQPVLVPPAPPVVLLPPAPVAPTATPAQSTAPSARVTLAAPAEVTHGSHGLVRGWVNDAASRAGLAGVPITVTFSPVRGAVSTVSTVTVVTHADGSFSVTDPGRLMATTRVTATTGAPYGSASAALTVEVGVRVVCRAVAVAHRGNAEAIVCAVPGVPTGSVVSLLYHARSAHGVLRAKAAAGLVTFRLTLARKGWITVRATTSATSRLAASSSRGYAVHVL